LNQTTPESDSFGNGKPVVVKSPSRLITFPGVTHRTVPPWRQELRERVREVQERKAQEAAAEGATMQVAEVAGVATTQLELLPQAEALDVNPLVIAALKRIERAHQTAVEEARPSYPARLSATAGATDQRIFRGEVRQESSSPAYIPQTVMHDDNHQDVLAEDRQLIDSSNPEPEVSAVSVSEVLPFIETEQVAERNLNLIVTPAPAVETDLVVEPTAPPEPVITKPKPKRIISDDASDPALNYLDLIGVACPQAAEAEQRAPLFSRLVAGMVDILCVGFLSVPFAAVVELRNDSWREPRVLIFMASVAVVVMFIYLTVSTALTGKTLGVKILSLRVIDTRTRLIPTGQQAAGRAFIYILSLATAGLCFLLALARGEGKTLHDRLSRTAVVRD
jgi:uncharacterized RDD family membrane protein YckC